MTQAEQFQAAIEVKAKSGLYDVDNVVRREYFAEKLADHVLTAASAPTDADLLASVAAVEERERLIAAVIEMWRAADMHHNNPDPELCRNALVRVRGIADRVIAEVRGNG